MENTNIYDIIVIGTGPAGCTSAKILAENGYNVLLVEKFKLPRYKSCSGQLIKKTLDWVETCFGEPVPVSALCTPTENKGMVFTNDKGKSYRFEQSGLNVWRSSFDYWLAMKASQFGAEVRDNTSALACEEKEGSVIVTLKGERIYTERARYIIDCEGVVGSLKRKLLGKRLPYITTFQTYNIGKIDLDYHYFHAYLQPTLSEYDAWLNVKDDKLVIGVAVKNPRNIKFYHNSFLSYLSKEFNLVIEEQLKSDKWLMPHIHPDCKIDYSIGHVLFAGEIAGFLNPMGEGISAALESGYYAAMSIIQHFDNLNMVSAHYKEKTCDLHRYMKRQWKFVADMTDSFKDFKR